MSDEAFVSAVRGLIASGNLMLRVLDEINWSPFHFERDDNPTTPLEKKLWAKLMELVRLAAWHRQYHDGTSQWPRNPERLEGMTDDDYAHWVEVHESLDDSFQASRMNLGAEPWLNAREATEALLPKEGT